MKYKKQLLLFAGLGFFASIHAQEAVTVSGGSFKNENLTVSWSIGEVMTETFTWQPYTLTQGVQQPMIRIEPGIGLPEMKDYEIWVYPNPASDAVIVSVAELMEHPLTLNIFDMDGNLLNAAQITDGETRVSIVNFARGTYLLQIADRKNNVKTFKIIKQ